MAKKKSALLDGEIKDVAEGALVRIADEPPTEIPAIVLHDLVPFPGPFVPVLLKSEVRREAVAYAKANNGFIFFINKKASPSSVKSIEDISADTEGVSDVAPSAVSSLEGEEEDVSEGVSSESEQPSLSMAQLNPVGIVARLVKVVKMPDDKLSALVQLLRRGQLLDMGQTEPFPLVRVMYPAEVVHNEKKFQALYRQVRMVMGSFLEAHPTVSEEFKKAAFSIEEPALLADFVGQHMARDYAERLSLLTQLDLDKRMKSALEIACRELDLLTVGNRISKEIREKVEKHQRDFLLREQLKSIRTELGEEKDAASLAVSELTKKLDQAGLPEAARARADEELKRLQLLSAESPEGNTIRSYLDWIACLPWSKKSQDLHDIARAKAILDADHYGLSEVKERILEFLAVHQLNPHKTGSILCLSGPPGVGKTSLGQSIAKALGREFYRFSVGGMRDEAEIKGHRRTYVGAMPGRILQGLKQVKTSNPVFMLDELDKMGSDWRGDPASALLEVLDPSQNKAFMDHYLDLPFDLSKVMFIATANVHSEIPWALLDRLEVIDLPGYIPEEKREIAERYLVPRQREEHGLTKTQLQLQPKALDRVIREYTHEAGVRELERLVGKVCRKRAMRVVQGEKGPMKVSAADVPQWLGPPKKYEEPWLKQPPAGVVLGLAWTPVGGDVLFIESVLVEGKGDLKVTGQLGDVMAESTRLAMSYVRHGSKHLNIDPAEFHKWDIHLHFPAGAVKKDGPSAGIAITTALISLFTNKPIKAHLAMTGEMTLRGDVLPVGGIREKVVAAKRAGVQTVVLPERNRSDVEVIPAQVKEGLEFVFASHYNDVLKAAWALEKQTPFSQVKKKTSKKTKSK
jgi:ATP-dependent Lon protease